MSKLQQYLIDNNLPFITWMDILVSVDVHKFTNKQLKDYNKFVYDLQKKSK